MFSNARVVGVRSVMTLSACALVYLVAAGQAYGYDPQAEACTGLGVGPKQIEVKVEPNTAGSASSLMASALLCGNDINKSDWTKSKGFLSGSITLPSAKNKSGSVRSIITRCANPANPSACTSEPDLNEGQYVGDVGMGVTLADGFINLSKVITKIYVNKAPDTPELSNDTCSAKAIACYQGEDVIGTGYANMEVIKQSKGQLDAKTGKKLATERYTLVINKIKLKPDLEDLAVQKVYYTRIGYPDQPVEMCTYAGAVNGDKCGSKAEDWVQKNGPKSHNSCDVADWLFAGKLVKSSIYNGTGFIVRVDDSEVKGANYWWGMDPLLTGPDGKTNLDFLKKQIVYVGGKATLPNPLCAPLEIV